MSLLLHPTDVGTTYKSGTTLKKEGGKCGSVGDMAFLSVDSLAQLIECWTVVLDNLGSNLTRGIKMSPLQIYFSETRQSKLHVQYN